MLLSVKIIEKLLYSYTKLFTSMQTDENTFKISEFIFDITNLN